MTDAVGDARAELLAAADPDRAAWSTRYFQVRPGGYGEGDRFLGVPVPVQRAVARRHGRRLGLAGAAELLGSPLHEERLTAVFVLVALYRSGGEDLRAAVVDLVLERSDRLDGWDLVDACAPAVLGPWLLTRDRSVLLRLAASDLVWDRRTAMMATFAFVRAGEVTWTLDLAERLLDDPHDLGHKAAGWMLREVGMRDPAALHRFLAEHRLQMPRVMLRSATEKLDAADRARYLAR